MQKVLLGSEGRERLIQGINLLADSVVSTLGPQGRNVIYTGDDGNVLSTKDGVTVAKVINDVEDPIANMGIKLIKQSAIKTADNAGDGTTTSTLLAREIAVSGLMELEDSKNNAVKIKREIESAVKEVLAEIKTNFSTEISSEEQVEQIATISANNDPEIGKLISTAMNKVGREGIVTIEESKSGETYLEVVEGIQFDRGYKSHYFVTNNESMTSVLDNPLILITDARFSTAKELLPILQHVSTINKSLLIICSDIDAEALATLILNKTRGALKVCAVKAPDFGDRQKLILDDIAIMTGGIVVSKDRGMNIEKFDTNWFGSSRLAKIGKEQTTIIDGAGTADKIEDRAKDLIAQIEVTTSHFEKEKLQERLAKFAGGVSIIHVGGFTEADMKEKKDRVEDALFATRAAIDMGIVPGGGIALLKARNIIKSRKELGYKIVYNACSAPFITILSNAGWDTTDIESFLKRVEKADKNFGLDVSTGKVINMIESGIIDPVKVTTKALTNAASIASTILLTETVVFTERSKEANTDTQYNFM